MSRRFSKIMIICAMVVLFPLLIVGTAFASYYSISAIVEVDTYVNYSNVAADANAFAGVLYNNQNEKAFTIEESHMNTLSLKATTNGYTFQGWFNGDQTAYNEVLAAGEEAEFVSTAAALNVDITEYESLLAVFNVKEYNVTYKYKAQPNDTDEVTETKHYYFGDALLPQLSYAGVDYKFAGWQVEGGSQAYTTATFAEEGDVTLVGVWEKQTQIDVNYFAEDETTLLKTTKIYQDQDFTLETIDQVFASASKEKLAGYRYSWVDDNGATISEINRKSSINVYAAKEAIIYDVTLNTNGATFNGSKTAKVSMLDASALAAWFDASKWYTGYSFHEIAGIEYNGQTYLTAAAAGNLRNQIVEENPNGLDGAVEVGVVIAKNFSTISIENGISFKAASGNSVYNKAVYTAADLGKFAYELPAYDVDSSEIVFDLLNMNLGDGEVLKLYTADGTEVELVSLKITIGTTTLPTIAVNGTESLNDVIEKILAKTQIADASVLTITSITANFNVVA